MKQLDIKISKAQLISFGVELKDGKPEVHASIALLTDGGKKITDYTIFTDSWHENKFELPVQAMPFYEKGTHNMGESFFLNIRKGDTAKNNSFVAHAIKLCDLVVPPVKSKKAKVQP